MNFVAGVSHELRTPLTVIRTAAYNLRGNLANQPGQVARYGALIQRESEKLSALVEQVLRYGNVTAGRVLQERVPLAIEELIESSVQEARISLEHQELVVEKRIEPGLPRVLADEVAMKHALRNLLDNALKYGTQANNWIGIVASVPQNGERSTVEIRIADRGPGIPPQELEHIFDSFFRGRRALQDQIHGTGLGLSLVRKIVEAHGGTVSVKSKQGEGVEFIVRIPAVPSESQNELAHSSR
jgi:signal transduction histidine kinase